MNANKYGRTIAMNCPTCGGTQFSVTEDDARELVTCASCGRETTKEELLRENSENIEEHVKEVGDQVVKDVSRQLQDSLKKALRGNKNIRIK